MDSDTQKQNEPTDPRIYFAAERTLLAWMRTGLAMMGFGFVVARFGLFLREISVVHLASSPHQQRLSLWTGTALVLLGVAVNLSAPIKHWHTIRRLEKGLPLRFHPISIGSIAALLLVLVGLLMAVHLLFGMNFQE